MSYVPLAFRKLLLNNKLSIILITTMVLDVSVALLAVLERELPRLMWIVGSIIILIMVVLSLSIFIKQIGIRETVQIDKLDPQLA